MKSVLLVNQSTGYLMTDIVNEYVRSGNYDRVELFAGEINIRPSVPDPSVRIIKTVKYNKKTVVSRILTWTLSFFHLLFVVWTRSKDCTLFLVSNPPLTIFVPLLCKKRFCYVVYDLYPDSLFSQGFIGENSAIGRCWIHVNEKVFARAEAVFTLSEDMKNAVSKYVTKEKIIIVDNWAHNEHITPIDKASNVFLDRLGLKDKFIVLYSGNMGMTHDVDVLVDVAKILRGYSNIEFIFIGEGAKKPIVESKISEYRLNNCTVLGFQPSELLPHSMGAADIAVVTTDRNQSGLSVPSKTYTYLATGAAILCLAEKETELDKLMAIYKCGECYNSAETQAIADFILNLSKDNNLLQVYKNNSRIASMAFSPENATKYVI